MPASVPLSTWAESHGLSRVTALNMAHRGKIKGAKLTKITTACWYVPVDAVPDLTDRRRKNGPHRRRADASPA
jgi:hypothetical protein